MIFTNIIILIKTIFQITQAYNKLSEIYNPDYSKTASNKKQFVKQFWSINEAHKILSSSTTRRLYDTGVYVPPTADYVEKEYFFNQVKNGTLADKSFDQSKRSVVANFSLPKIDYSSYLIIAFFFWVAHQ